MTFGNIVTYHLARMLSSVKRPVQSFRVLKQPQELKLQKEADVELATHKQRNVVDVQLRSANFVLKNQLKL